MFAALGLIPQEGITMGPDVDAISEGLLMGKLTKEHEESILANPHGSAWHTSFHASSFPGSDPKACAREALYGLMGVPGDEVTQPWLAMVGDAGKDIEVRYVKLWEEAGLLLTASADSKHQTTWTDPDHWLSCSPDAVLNLAPDWKSPLPVDVKGKDHMVIEQMRAGIKGPEPKHVKQLMVQIHFTRIHQQNGGWRGVPNLELCEGGSLLYVSRNRPRTAQEFYFEYDEKMIQDGLAKLHEWMGFFVMHVLPQRDKSWRWTEEPCKWCDFKKLCKADTKAGIDDLRQSVAIEYAEKVTKGKYDYVEARRDILKRWEK